MDLELTEGLHRQLRRAPDAKATVFGERRQTWRDLAERSARLAAALHARHGAERPRRHAGAQCRPLSRIYAWRLGRRRRLEPRQHALEPGRGRVLARRLRHPHSSGRRTFPPMLPELRARSRSLSAILYFGEGEAPEGTLHAGRLMQAATPAPDARRGGEDLAGVFYTGGTTGFPKGVMLSHNAFAGNAICGLLDVNYDADEIILAVVADVSSGGHVHRRPRTGARLQDGLRRGLRSAQGAGAIARERTTFTLLVPTMLQRLIECADFSAYDTTSLRKIIYGASPINESLLNRLLEALPKVAFYQGYGMTETAGLTRSCRPNAIARPIHKTARACARRAGRPGASTCASWIIDGAEVPPRAVGEIVARGVGIMQGYWNRETETRAAFRDGWLRSGDMGFVDEDGYLFIVDRLKDMIVSGGENIYSAEVENALARHPAIASCAVIGVPSERWGEQVHAVVVLRAGAETNIEQLREHCRGFIAGYKCPVSVEFRDALPLSAAGKLLKHVLRAPYWEGKGRNVG